MQREPVTAGQEIGLGAGAHSEARVSGFFLERRLLEGDGGLTNGW